MRLYVLYDKIKKEYISDFMQENDNAAARACAQNQELMLNADDFTIEKVCDLFSDGIVYPNEKNDVMNLTDFVKNSEWFKNKNVKETD